MKPSLWCKSFLLFLRWKEWSDKGRIETRRDLTWAHCGQVRWKEWPDKGGIETLNCMESIQFQGQSLSWKEWPDKGGIETEFGKIAKLPSFIVGKNGLAKKELKPKILGSFPPGKRRWKEWSDGGGIEPQRPRPYPVPMGGQLQLSETGHMEGVELSIFHA